MFKLLAAHSDFKSEGFDKTPTAGSLITEELVCFLRGKPAWQWGFCKKTSLVRKLMDEELIAVSLAPKPEKKTGACRIAGQQATRVGDLFVFRLVLCTIRETD